MEIKTNKSSRDTEIPEVDLPPDRSMYLRRKATQQVRKSHSVSRTVIRAFRLAGKLGVFVLALAFLASVLIYAFNSEKFSLRKVNFEGCKNLDPRQLEEIIRKDFPSRLLRIDLKQLRSRIEAETWCRRAEIRRILPSELLIYIQERTPSVVLEIQGDLTIADDEGVLLGKYDPKLGRLDVPVFKGLLGDNAESYRLYQEENARRVRLGLTLLADLEAGSEAFTRNISEVDLSDKANVRVMLLDDTAEILLGDRDFLKRYRTLMANMGKYRELKLQYTEMASIDLRFDGQIIFRPRKSAEPRAVATAELRR